MKTSRLTFFLRWGLTAGRALACKVAILELTAGEGPEWTAVFKRDDGRC